MLRDCEKATKFKKNLPFILTFAQHAVVTKQTGDSLKFLGNF